MIELQRLGVETIAVDRYADAPAMQVAHRSHVIDMLDPAECGAWSSSSGRTSWCPEIEAIRHATLLELEAEGVTVDPDGARRPAHHGPRGHPPPRRRGARAADLAVPLRRHRRASLAAVEAIGLPCVVKPVMSSSGKGQSIVRAPDDVAAAWDVRAVRRPRRRRAA